MFFSWCFWQLSTWRGMSFAKTPSLQWVKMIEVAIKEETHQHRQRTQWRTATSKGDSLTDLRQENFGRRLWIIQPSSASLLNPQWVEMIMLADKGETHQHRQRTQWRTATSKVDSLTDLRQISGRNQCIFQPSLASLPCILWAKLLVLAAQVETCRLRMRNHFDHHNLCIFQPSYSITIQPGTGGLDLLLSREKNHSHYPDFLLIKTQSDS